MLLIIVVHCYYSLAPRCYALFFFVAIDSLLLHVATPHCHVLLPFLNFSLLGVITHCWCALLLLFNSSLLGTTIPHYCALLLFPLIVVVWLLEFGTTPNLCFWASDEEETWNSSFKLNFFKVSFHLFSLFVFIIFPLCLYVCMCV